nr:hypothetical protein [Tanacetum cinerariifolium]
DQQIQNVGGNGGNRFGQYAGQVVQNQQGFNAWQNGGIQGIQLQAEEFDFMAAASDLDKIEEVNANCILMENLQQASTSGTQHDRAPVYDTDSSAKVVQICLWYVDSGCFKHMTENIKLLINFVWKFLGIVRFGNDHIAAILGYGDLKWGNITITERLHLLHTDLCGPMRVASINGKRYVLVIVDDYSRYTWVHFLITKYETPEVIKNFLKKIYVRLQAPVIIVHTDNGTKFKNQVLKEYFDSVGITHENSAAKTPQQNAVVERRNRMLVEATRTMLIFSHALLFLLAEAIATACYTQNHSIITDNDREDIGKLGAKGDTGFFIGYSANSVTYRVYNQRTRKIMETMNVTFDELSAMAFKQNSSRPDLQSMTSGQISSELKLTYTPSTITPQRPSKRDLDILFEPLHNEYLGGRPLEAPRTIHVAPMALYGLKQVLRAWYDELSAFLLQNGFSKGTTDPTLFTRSFDDDILVDFGFELTGFSDADYAGCKDTFKSTSGGAQFLGKKIVSWTQSSNVLEPSHTVKSRNNSRVLRIIFMIMPEHQSDVFVIFTVTMEILLEPTSNKLLVCDVGDSIWIELMTLDINLGPE